MAYADLERLSIRAQHQIGQLNRNIAAATPNSKGADSARTLKLKDDLNKMQAHLNLITAKLAEPHEDVQQTEATTKVARLNAEIRQKVEQGKQLLVAAWTTAPAVPEVCS